VLSKPDARILSALATLEHDKDFQLVLMWLAGSLDEIRKANDSTKDEVLTRWNQGASQAIAEFIDSVKGARDAVARRK
jgi:hypothetical protein